MFIASCALLQIPAAFNRLLERDFLTCYSCLYYSYIEKKYDNIWDKVSADIKKEFDSEPIYNKTFL